MIRKVRYFHKTHGATMMQYAIIAGLISIVVIGGLVVLGLYNSGVFTKLQALLSGEEVEGDKDANPSALYLKAKELMLRMTGTSSLEELFSQMMTYYVYMQDLTDEEIEWMINGTGFGYDFSSSGPFAGNFEALAAIYDGPYLDESKTDGIMSSSIFGMGTIITKDMADNTSYSPNPFLGIVFDNNGNVYPMSDFFEGAYTPPEAMRYINSSHNGIKFTQDGKVYDPNTGTTSDFSSIFAFYDPPKHDMEYAEYKRDQGEPIL